MLRYPARYRRSCLSPSGRAAVTPWYAAHEPHLHLSSFATGLDPLDAILGGGLPQGRITELSGYGGSGKTTLALHLLARAQGLGQLAVLIDSDRTFNGDRAQALGCDLTRLRVSQVNEVSQVFSLLRLLVRRPLGGVVVVDSLASLLPEPWPEEPEAFTQGQTLALDQALTYLIAQLNRSRSRWVVLFTNQLRRRAGVLYGNPNFPVADGILSYRASLRLTLNRILGLKHPGEPWEYGFQVKAKVDKHCLAAPYTHCHLTLSFAQGFQDLEPEDEEYELDED
ncbi:RecA/RadA recombinase [Leptolyngbya sp. PCC 6406]|uniref:RecA/RadA recombinase n=1 Tax=Leptolyngbya sp. PCC 6406 TaxID=1173264 RepID=UPI0002ABC09F|nr:RecA/RadA recombinase [Leptolyngbya sp. PCC 6406]